MRISFCLVVVFGSASWLGTNSIWMELPLLTSVLPEGWSLPSYLAMVVQIACIGPLVYGVLHKCVADISSSILIVAALLAAVLCQSLMAILWSKTVDIFGGSYSLALYVLMFGLALVNATSNVLFMPFMAQFHHSLLTAYFVGMGLSSLVPSLVSLLQGTSNYECVAKPEGGLQPLFHPPRFGVSVYMWSMAGWTLLATVAFLLLNKTDKAHTHKKSETGNKDESSPLNGGAKETEMREIEENGRDGEVTTNNQNAPTPKKAETTYAHVCLLLLTAIVNAQMNGVVPSVHSYAALPYSQTVYHLGLTLSNIISPIASFLPLVCSTKSLPSLALLTGLSSLTTGLIIFQAMHSPGLLISQGVGGALSVVSVVLAAGLHGYLRTLFASLLRESGEHSEHWLFWCGVFIQIGSFLGSAVMFPLVNFTSLFQPAPMCR